MILKSKCWTTADGIVEHKRNIDGTMAIQTRNNWNASHKSSNIRCDVWVRQKQKLNTKRNSIFIIHSATKMHGYCSVQRRGRCALHRRCAVSNEHEGTTSGAKHRCAHAFFFSSSFCSYVIWIPTDRLRQRYCAFPLASRTLSYTGDGDFDVIHL